MPDEISRGVSILIDVIIAGIILGLAVGLWSIVSLYNRNQSEVYASQKTIKEYREFNKYKDKELQSQDVISVILEYRDTLEFWVDSEEGDGVSWALKMGQYYSTPITDYSQENLSEKFKPEDKYFCRLVRSTNGEVLGMKFYKGEPPTLADEKFRSTD